MARLTGFVHVDGAVYGPDDEVPAEVAARITNPRAWEGGVLPLTDDAGPAATSAADGDTPTEPPRSGAGSGRDAWVAYAAARGLEVADDASRDQIITAVDKANQQ